MGFRFRMRESKVWKSEEIPRQPQQDLNAQAIAHTIAEVEIVISQAEAIIVEIERVVTMAEEAQRSYDVLACGYALLDVGYFTGHGKTPCVVNVFEVDLEILVELP
ncbi:hypothetical protein H5410_050504 [Solanum commersonii]|uniref:Uncharacterized protein n=1 Tax=Solanum commersonii TaxID=4109 RepID=A0A9J5WX91_SOLCO|nr:hypothetical protein H5410_050504 [Solanum commersonii]